MDEHDYFKESFKYFKKRSTFDILHNVIDFINVTNEYVVPLYKDSLTLDCPSCLELGLVPHGAWETYSLKGLNGFVYIKNPFSVDGQQCWIQKCLELYPCKPSITNLDLHHKDVDDIWQTRCDPDPIKRSYIDKLSWATLGYHHNWDTKHYNPSKYSAIPECLSSLAKHIASCLGFQTFKAEATIVNYYNNKSCLGIHNDHSEEELNKPIISLSLGQSAIFLLGTHRRREKPIPILLRSGDIIILSGACRLSYHAVPAIIRESISNRYCTSDLNDRWKPYHQYIGEHRINISMRQVYRDNAT